MDDLKRALIATAILVVNLPGHGYGQSSVSQDLSTRVAEVFADNCFSCHNQIHRKGGLNLQTYEVLLEGGDRGSDLVPGRPDESRLLAMVEGFEEPVMPLGGALQEDQIDLIRTWIEKGAAPWDGDLSEVNLRQVPQIAPRASQRADITSLQFSPDGKWLAAGAYQVVKLINPVDRKVDSELSGHAESVRALAFSPDGQWLVSAGGHPARSGEIKVWDLESRELLKSLQGHDDAIYSVAFHPTEPVICSGSYDKRLLVWSAATGEKLLTIPGHVDAVYETVFSRDGRWVLSASADRTIKVWSASSGKQLFKPMSESTAELMAMAVHPSGQEISAAGTDKLIRTWKLSAQGGTLLRSTFAHDGAVLDLAYTPDGKTLVSSGEDLLVKFWDSHTLEETGSLEKQPDWVSVLAVSPDGRSLALGRYDGTLKVVPVPGESTGREDQIAN